MKRIFWALLATSVMSSAGLADTWKEADDKGLFVYSIGNGASGQLTLVCDPDNLWASDENKESSQFYLFATRNNQRLSGKSISLAIDGFKGSFPYEGGAVVISDAQSDWSKMIEALSLQGQVNVSVGKNRFTLTIDRPTKLRCQRAAG